MVSSNLHLDIQNILMPSGLSMQVLHAGLLISHSTWPAHLTPHDTIFYWRGLYETLCTHQKMYTGYIFRHYNVTTVCFIQNVPSNLRQNLVGNWSRTLWKLRLVPLVGYSMDLYKEFLSCLTEELLQRCRRNRGFFFFPYGLLGDGIRWYWLYIA